MYFSNKRGRPRKTTQEKDYGTNELINKKNLNLTMEPLDLCLEKRIITEEQHQAGIHLRWLHSIQFGIPSVTVNAIYSKSYSTRCEDLEWREAREKEYSLAINILQGLKCKTQVIDLCIYNKTPAFLLVDFKNCSLLNKKLLYFDYSRLIEGLKALEELWVKGVRKRLN